MSNVIKNDVTKFGELFQFGIDKIREACQLYVKALDADKSNFNKFREAYPDITEELWTRFELTGRGMIDNRLTLDVTPSTYALVKMPLSVQRKALGEGIELLAKDGSALTVKPCNLTKMQVKQAFARDHIRTLPEQRAWVEEQYYKVIPEKAEHSQWEIRNGKLVIYQPSTFTLKDLARIIADLR